MSKPIASTSTSPFAAAGNSFHVYEWSGSGPDYTHVHHADDEAWHVLEGSLVFTFGTPEEVEAGPGATVFVQAGTPHAYREGVSPCRYLIILTPRLNALIEELHKTPYKEHGEAMRRYESEIL
jgi:mannose-6-phosphate isomerase-like protein (cupin superfamily)